MATISAAASAALFAGTCVARPSQAHGKPIIPEIWSKNADGHLPLRVRHALT
jgi:hypothetical protein